MEKPFMNWILVKKTLHERSSKTIKFKEREIWWCSLGCNVGDEEDGKNSLFSRPVLILKKFNQNIFYGLPLTTKIKDNQYYFKVRFKDEIVSVMVSQMRLIDVKRLSNRLGTLNEGDFIEVKQYFKALF